MNVRKMRVVEPEPVLTELAVCYVAWARRFVVRYTVHWTLPTREIACETVRYPLTRRQLIRQSGGPELADRLMERPDYWWRMPLSRYSEEEYAA